jgi:hypothetical protein
MRFSESLLYTPADYKTHGFSVRLFRDNCPGKALELAEVGDIICGHGKAHAATSGDLICGSQKVAIVAYKGDAGTADTSAGSDSYSGLAIAMQDVAGTYAWFTAENVNCVVHSESVTDALSMDGDWMKGIYNTNRLAKAACGSGHVHAAAQAAVNYENTVSHPAGTSQWFLPTIGQWNLIVKGLTGSSTDLSGTANTDYLASNINPIITAAGGTGFTANHYWSSVESNAYGGWIMRFGEGWIYLSGKHFTYPVRPVLAF